MYYFFVIRLCLFLVTFDGFFEQKIFWTKKYFGYKISES